MLFSVQQYMYVPSPCPATLVAMRGAVRDHQLAMIITCEDVAMEAQIDLPPPPRILNRSRGEDELPIADQYAKRTLAYGSQKTALGMHT